MKITITSCELGPRGTGKSHIYKEISPNSILVSGGQTTVANLFYNMSSKAIGLVGMWEYGSVWTRLQVLHLKIKMEYK
ncbi:BREX system Lon protease-like protein BrxL [Paraclostridium bifermentans]|nr:BREX system Lon protease-like protein BrxL [Paraclostridium bifermentans]